MSAAINRRPRIVLADHPWPDVEIEQAIFDAAGCELIAGPVQAPTPAEVEAMVRDADPAAILTCWAEVSADAIQRPSDLVVVTRLGIGLDNIAIEAATRRGAWVTNVPDYCVDEVADHAAALFLASARGVVSFDRASKQGRWAPEDGKLLRTRNLTVGIIGFGRIGQATASRIAAFGCRILAHSKSLSDAGPLAEAVDLSTLQEQSDVIILNVPLTGETHHLVDAGFLAACSKKPFLINVSRGPLVDNNALLAALESGQLRGAGLDVIEGEPNPPAELMAHPAAIVTPHVAFLSDASLIELRRRACEDVVRVLEGSKPLHACNEPAAALAGGVASDVRIVDGKAGKQVVKRALGKLKVEADWFSDPKRSATEVAALRVGRKLLGADAVPEVLWDDKATNSFAMAFVPPPFESWKDRLIAGRVEPDVADRAGALLGRLHASTMSAPELEARFQDTLNFDELRIDPFFRRTALAAPDLTDEILAAATGMEGRRTALVHGDYSPKNLLTDGHGVVVIDWEVAHWGDPRFDVAFCLSHLLLKAHRKDADAQGLIDLGARFSASYRALNPGVWDAALVAITGTLLVTRLVGPSPVDYRATLDAPAVMALAHAMLRPSGEALPFFFSDIEVSEDAQPA